MCKRKKAKAHLTAGITMVLQLSKNLLSSFYLQNFRIPNNKRRIKVFPGDKIHKQLTYMKMIAFIVGLLAGMSVASSSYCQTNSCILHPDLLDGQKVFKVADNMPEYSGGQAKLLADIRAQFKYPDEQAHRQEKVNITFVIDTLGQVRNACIFKPFDEKATTPIEQTMLAIVTRLPPWRPGTSKAKKVAVRIILPILIEERK